MGNQAFTAWARVCEKWDVSGYASLLPAEKVWFSVRMFLDNAKNGGIISYYYNSGADYLADCMAAVEKIGNDDVLEGIARANSLFGDRVPESQDERNLAISSWADRDQLDSFLSAIDDDISQSLDALEEQLEQFVQEQGLLD